MVAEGIGWLGTLGFCTCPSHKVSCCVPLVSQLSTSMWSEKTWMCSWKHHSRKVPGLRVAQPGSALFFLNPLHSQFNVDVRWWNIGHGPNPKTTAKTCCRVLCSAGLLFLPHWAKTHIGSNIGCVYIYIYIHDWWTNTAAYIQYTYRFIIYVIY